VKSVFDSLDIELDDFAVCVRNPEQLLRLESDEQVVQQLKRWMGYCD
jgi:hypothetical protein